ncbi:MAG TPA: hypothetical protein VGM75_16420 [Pseudonocardiaceae bacterium]
MSKLPELHESWLPKEHALYRPRHGGRQRVALICAIVFVLLPSAAFALGVRPVDFENRRLTSFPSLAQGWSFFTQLSPWATDHLPLREQAVHAADGVSQGVFGEPAPFGQNTGNTNANGITPLPANTAPVPSPIEFPNVLEGKDGWLYLGAEFAGPCQQGQAIGSIVAELNKLRNGVVASGRKFVVAIAPDKATMVPQYLPDDYPGKDCHDKATTAFWQAMTKLNYVLDLRSDLTVWGTELGAPIYGPQDAHWSDQGGVSLTRRIADALQPGISDSWLVQPGPAWTVPADLPPLMGRSDGTTTGLSYSILPDGIHNETHDVDTDYVTKPVHLSGAVGMGTYSPPVGMLADSFTIRSARYLGSVFGNLTIDSASNATGNGVGAVTQLLVQDKAVVVEVAQRTLVAGDFNLLFPSVENAIIRALTAHPMH